MNPQEDFSTKLPPEAILVSGGESVVPSVSPETTFNQNSFKSIHV
jgi:hypothetical protein